MKDLLVDFNCNITKVKYYSVKLTVRLQLRVLSFSPLNLINRLSLEMITPMDQSRIYIYIYIFFFFFFF